MIGFGKFAHEKRLAKALRKRPLDANAVDALMTAVCSRVHELPWGLLWKLHVQAKQAMDEVTEQSPLWIPLYQIFRSALGEVQNRSRAQ